MALEAQEVAVRVRLLGGAAFKAEADSVSSSVAGIGKAGKAADVSGSVNKSHGALTKLGSKASKVGGQMIGFGRTMTMAGVPIAALGYYAIKSSASFGQAMTLLSTQAGMARKSIGPMSTAVENMATKFGATPTALADALYPIESIGLRGGKALTALKAAAMGSATGLDSLENTADAVTTAMASKIKGTGGPVEAMSIMDKSIGLGKMHLSDLTESFKSGIIPISQQFGLNFKQILSAAAGLTRVGIPANQVMARMRLTLTSMIAPTAAGQKAMSTMGISQFQLADDLRKPGGLLTALKDIKTHADALGNKDESNNLIAQMFGKSRGMASIGSLLEQLPQISSIYGKVMATTPATLDQHFQQTTGTSSFKYKQIQAAFYTGMIKLGNELNTVLLPLLVKLIPVITSMIRWFGQLPGPVKKFLVVLAAAVVVGGPLLMFTGALVKSGGMVLGAGAKVYKALFGVQVAADAAAGSEGAAGLAGFGLALSRVIPIIGLFMVALSLRNRVKPAVKHAVNHALHPGKDTENDLRSGGGSYGLGPFGNGNSHFGGGLNILGIHIPGLATGGTVMGGGLAMVGEQGPELLSLPRGARVSPNIGPSGFGGTFENATLPGMPGSGEGGTEIIQLVVDGHVLTQIVNNRNRKNQNRR